MKRFFQSVALAGLVAASVLSRPAVADEGSYQIDVEVARIPAAAHELARAHVTDAGDWKHHLQAGDVQILEGGTTTGIFNHESLTHMGNKFPISYYDPRAAAFQVQYVDIGFKVDGKVRGSPSGMFEVEVRLDESAIVDVARNAPETEVYASQTMLLLKPGQVAILGSTSGHLTAQYLKRAYPKASFSEHDSFVLVASIRKH